MNEQQSKVTFDNSLPRLLDLLETELGKQSLVDGVVVRDATGRLSFFSRTKLSNERREEVARKVIAELGKYAYSQRPIASSTESGVARVLEDRTALPILQRGSVRCSLIDRRLVGADWLAEPVDQDTVPPRIVFGSLKGGVGRSTAISILAADLARRNRTVLVVDLDLEAPGVGHALLDFERLPKFGALDYLVENGIGGVADSDLAEYIGVSHLTQGAGLVDVLPVSGQTSRLNPENVMAKLSRAMVDDLPEEGDPISVRMQIREMVDRFSTLKAYDVVLIDARAGMAELAAGPLLGLGATVLLFGTAQGQTIDGYRSLLAALSMIANRNPQSQWRRRIKMVYAKAELDSDLAMRFSDELWDLFSTYLYDKEEGTENLDTFNFSPTDRTAPHFPLIIPFSQFFVNWDPVRNPTQLTAPFYETAFRPFLDAMDAYILTD